MAESKDRRSRRGGERHGRNDRSGSGRTGSRAGSRGKAGRDGGQRRSGGGRTQGGTGRGGASSGAGRTDHRDRGGARQQGSTQKKVVRKDLSAARAALPRWVVDEITRTTSSTKAAGAIESLGKASEAFQEGAFQRAARHAAQAKELAPRYAYIREVLGLATYRAGDWERGLAELRAYRRMSGDTSHLPVEMDILRALGRDRAVDNAWEELQKRGGRAPTMKEGLVVYGSHLLDQGRAAEAWQLLGTQRVTAQAGDADRRVWYVAARAAAQLGDPDAAAKLRNAILEGDPAFPGIDELEAEIAAAGRRS